MVDISIIMPVYNKEKYLQTILNQLMNQSFNNYECLLIDDGSTDNSGLICDEFSNHDNRFKAFHKANGGVSNARNIGLDNVIGKYITFVDADDEIHDDFLLNLYNCIESTGAEIVVGSYIKFWDYKKDKQIVKYPNSNKVFKFENVLDTFVGIQKNTGIFGCCCSKIFKKSLINDIRFDSQLRLAEDFDFYLKIYDKIDLIYFDDKSYYYYRQEADNSSGLVNDYSIDYLSQLKINLRYKKFLIKYDTYQSNNKLIIDETINNYFFFSLFYCSINELNNRVNELYEIKENENINLHGKGFKQKILIGLFNRKQVLFIKLILMIYRKTRRI